MHLVERDESMKFDIKYYGLHQSSSPSSSKSINSDAHQRHMKIIFWLLKLPTKRTIYTLPFRVNKLETGAN